MNPRFRLKLKRLDFISPVDHPAQETAKVLLIKRKGAVEGEAKVVKVEESLGLVFCWAFTSKVAGADYYDLHSDNIDQDFIKAAAEFMQSGGLTDEMHDGVPDGRVVFAMPMTPEIAKAYGVHTDTIGLMVALKPSPDVLAKFKSGEYTAVSIAGLGERIQVKSKGGSRTQPAIVSSGVLETADPRVLKRGLLTTAEEGHSHLLDDGDGAGAGYTSCECMGEGDSATYHSHPWSRNDAGDIVIGMSAGHAHVVLDPGNADEATVEAHAPVHAAHNKSTPSNAVRTVKGNSKESSPMDKDQQIADLKKHLAAAIALASLTDAQKAYASKLPEHERDAFVGKSALERDSILKAAVDADPVEYTTKAGMQIRKSAGPLAVELAKQVDSQADAIANATLQVQKANDARELAEIHKRADKELTHIGKRVEVRAAILKALDGIADEAVRKDAHEALKGTNAIVQAVEKAHGATAHGQTDPETPIAKFNAKLGEFAKTVNKTAQFATSEFLNTAEGAQLYADAFPAVRA